MNKHELPVNPFEKPNCILLWEQFMERLVQRELAGCTQLLDEQPQTIQDYQRQFVDYCRAILFIENNQWDRGEQLLIPLLQNMLHPAFHMRILNVRAVANDHLGRLAEAMALYEAAMRYAEQQDDKVFWAKAMKNRATCAIRSYETGQMTRECFLSIRTDLEQTIQIFQSIVDRLEEGRCWNELGAFHKALGQWVDAIHCYEQDLTICREQHHQHGIAACLNNIGEALSNQRRYAPAESMAREAAALFAAVEDPYQQADALVNLGRALAGQGKLTDAQDAFDQAIRCVESVRREIRADLARNDFFATQIHIYGAKIAHALQQGAVETAFNCTEQARARGLLELLAKATIRPPRTFPPALVEREHLLRTQWMAVADKISAHARIAEQTLDEFYRELQLLAPDYAALRSALPLSAAQIIAHLPIDTAICAYFGLPDQLVCFVLTQKDGVTAVRLPVTVSNLASASLDGVGRPRSLLPTAGGELTHPWLLEKLHGALIEPLLAQIAHCRRLVLLPHGALHHLPLHAAYDPQTQQFLCERFDILYTPSATIQSARLPQRQTQLQRSGVLAVAPGAADLVHPPAEARTIAQICGGVVLTGQAATTHQVLQQAQHYRYLHIAGHAHFRPDTPLLSGVALVDQHLTAWDLLQTANLGCALVSINGCESGVSRVQTGDELVGLVRALLYAVAPSVLLTLWPIHDLAARIFAQLFYHQINSQPMTAEKHFAHILHIAIDRFRRLSQEAVRALLLEDGLTGYEIDVALAQLPSQQSHGFANQSQAPFAHPYFWAPYLLIGEVWEEGQSL